MDKIFEKKEYVVSGPFGICIVENITKLVAGREQQMEYYVLRSISDKTKKCYIPVKDHETVLRVPMTEEEAGVLLDKIKVTLKQAPDNVERNEENLLQINGIFTFADAKEILESGEPNKWGKAVCYLYQNASSIDSQMEDVLEKIWKNLREELAFVLKRTQEEICSIVENANSK